MSNSVLPVGIHWYRNCICQRICQTDRRRWWNFLYHRHCGSRCYQSIQTEHRNDSRLLCRSVFPLPRAGWHQRSIRRLRITGHLRSRTHPSYSRHYPNACRFRNSTYFKSPGKKSRRILILDTPKCNLGRSLLQKGYVLNWFLGCPFLYFKVSQIKQNFPY